LRQLIVLITGFTNKDAAARRFIPVRPMQFGDFRFRRFSRDFAKKPAGTGIRPRGFPSWDTVGG
jgi:hypothetical protein